MPGHPQNGPRERPLQALLGVAYTTAIIASDYSHLRGAHLVDGFACARARKWYDLSMATSNSNFLPGTPIYITLADGSRSTGHVADQGQEGNIVWIKFSGNSHSKAKAWDIDLVDIRRPKFGN